MMYGHGYPFAYGGGVFGLGFVFNILVWVALAFLVVMFFKVIFGRGNIRDDIHRSTDTGEDAIAILKTRYAKGDINKKEYEEIRKEIAK